MRTGQLITIEQPTSEDMAYVIVHAAPRQQRFTLVNGLTVKAYLCGLTDNTVTLDGRAVHGNLAIDHIDAVTWEGRPGVERCECHRCKPL